MTRARHLTSESSHNVSPTVRAHPVYTKNLLQAAQLTHNSMTSMNIVFTRTPLMEEFGFERYTHAPAPSSARVRNEVRSMVAVLFEVYSKSETAESQYLQIAAELLPLLEKIDGFISVERFRGVTSKGKILSLSFWRDEKAVAKWREVYEHRCAQAKGRLQLFAKYRIRVFTAELLRDYGLADREQAPQQWNDVSAL